LYKNGLKKRQQSYRLSHGNLGTHPIARVKTRGAAHFQHSKQFLYRLLFGQFSIEFNASAPMIPIPALINPDTKSSPRSPAATRSFTIALILRSLVDKKQLDAHKLNTLDSSY
jgi:hypothetical protein